MAGDGPIPSYLFNIDYEDIMSRVQRRVRARIRRGIVAMFDDYALDSQLADIVADLRTGRLSPATLYRSFDTFLTSNDLVSDPVRQALDKAGLSVMRIASKDIGSAIARWAERTKSPHSPRDVRFDQSDPDLIMNIRRSGDLFWDRMMKEMVRAIREEVERSYFNNDSASTMADRLEIVAGLTPDQAESLDRMRKTVATGPLKPAQKNKVILENANRMRAIRAEAITRTELNRIANAGAVAYWEQMARRGNLDYNTTMLEWNTHPTERACPVCAPLDGIRVVIGGQFAAGVTGPPIHPNCRCHLELTYKLAPIIDIRKARDGDGDGWIDDGKPTMRPAPVRRVSRVWRDDVWGYSHGGSSAIANHAGRTMGLSAGGKSERRYQVRAEGLLDAIRDGKPSRFMRQHVTSFKAIPDDAKVGSVITIRPVATDVYDPEVLLEGYATKNMSASEDGRVSALVFLPGTRAARYGSQKDDDGEEITAGKFEIVGIETVTSGVRAAGKFDYDKQEQREWPTTYYKLLQTHVYDRDTDSFIPVSNYKNKPVDLSISLPEMDEYNGEYPVTQDHLQWSNPKYQEWKKKAESALGSAVRGRPISPDDDVVPDQVFHVTTGLGGVLRDGKIAARGEGGLGGDVRDRIVSMTTNKQTAQDIAADMRLVRHVADRELTGRDLVEWLRIQADKDGVVISDSRWESVMREAVNNGPASGLTAYMYSREFSGGRRNPLFFGLSDLIDKWQSETPGISDISIIQIPRENLRTGAQLTDFDVGQGFLDEVRLYGDVPIRGATVIPLEGDDGSFTIGGQEAK